MTSDDIPLDRPPSASASVLKSAAVRLLVYGGLGLAVLICLADLRSLLRREPVVHPSLAEPPSADPGWPHLRGPHYDAHSAETGLADAWPAKGPPVLWNREIGCGYSGVIAHGNCVYTQTQTLMEQKVLALDADTGQVTWVHGYGWPYDAGGMYPGPRATPTWSNGRVYFTAPNGVVRCLRAADGRALWSVDLAQRFGAQLTPFGYACSPLVEDGKVFLPVGGDASLAALDAENGATVWASGNMPVSYCSAIPITFRGKRQVVAFLHSELAGFDPRNGRLLWRRPCSHGYTEHAAFPLYAEPYLRTMQPFRAGSDRLFGSAHAGACNMAFCDGSVHQISYGIAPAIHAALANRKDGKKIDESMY